VISPPRWTCGKRTLAEQILKTTTPSRRASAPPHWTYVPTVGPWDECVSPSGFPRRHWRPLAVDIGRMGARELAQRWHMGQKLVRANGITYNVYGDPKGKERPWVLDPIPMVLDEQDWRYIETAVAQRATLLNAVLQDLYGERRLVRDGRFPPSLLFANPHFWRPCFDLRPPGGVYLHTYAADIARSPDGRWWVIADRTQAPSGIGYALENRLVSARTLPEVFHKCSVRPLNRFLEIQRDALHALAPNGKRNPRVVLLTPGPHNETYFEHSYLARQWGFPLVEGADLTVRDNRLFLKTLAGLEPIDLVLRRTDDSYCDPLELRGDSLLGIPGFTQAVRSGNVAVANALGSGLVESPAHMAFLPGLCRHLLGEDLQLPSVATWWCGQKQPRDYVTANLRDVVLKPTFAGRGRIVQFPANMDDNALEALRRKLEANPDEYVAQEQVTLSTAPVHAESGFVPRHVVLRVFAAWDGQNYTVMPGALTRVSTEASSLVVSNQQGGGSKDTWILGSTLETPAAPANEHPSWETSTALPSRVADNLFWLGRYAERVESGVRLVRCLLPGLSGEEDFGRTTIETIADLLTALGYLPEEFAKVSLAQKLRHTERLLADMVYDPAGTTGIAWNLKQLRRVAWPLKERLSQDTWRVLQQLEADLSTPRPADPAKRMTAQMDLLDRAIVNISALSGLWTENTTRGWGWHFLDIGRRLERALQMCDLLLAAIDQAPPDAEPPLETLLQIADSAITYRGRYFTNLRVEYVLNLLLHDASNPRSLRFQLERLLTRLQKMATRKDGGEATPLPGRVEEMLAAIRAASSEDLAVRDEDGNYPVMADLLRQTKGRLYDVSEALTSRYFSHLTATRLADAS